MTRLLDIEDMSTGYNGAAVVRHLDLHVDEGEVVALLGPNGAGKTTTLLTISQLVPIMSGDIRVMGESVDGVRPHLVARRGLAHVPEDRSLFFQLTVAENLRLGGSRGGADLDRALGYFPALAALFGFYGFQRFKARARIWIVSRKKLRGWWLRSQWIWSERMSPRIATVCG